MGIERRGGRVVAIEHETALITGAGSGIGRAIALSLAGAGVRLALLGRDRAKLDATREALGDAGRSAVVESCDVARREQVGATIGRVLEALGSIDLLVCNAGINVKRRRLEELDPADWDRMIATNLTGAYNLVHFTLPAMRERGRGLIVQICSVSGKRSSVLGGIGYSASKFGQAALGLGVHREERTHGIRSTVIYPGEVETPILANRPSAVEAARLQQILQPEDIAAAVRFVAELPARAHIPELIIQPAVDDYS